MPRVSPPEILRWFCVFPAAMLGSSIVQFIGILVWIFIRRNWESNAGSNFPFFFILPLTDAVASAAFVLAGGFTAPKYQTKTAFLLAILGTLLSLAKHILLQPGPGVINYLHFATETAGSLVAAATVLVISNRVLSRQGKEIDQAEGVDH